MIIILGHNWLKTECKIKPVESNQTAFHRALCNRFIKQNFSFLRSSFFVNILGLATAQRNPSCTLYLSVQPALLWLKIGFRNFCNSLVHIKFLSAIGHDSGHNSTGETKTANDALHFMTCDLNGCATCICVNAPLIPLIKC